MGGKREGEREGERQAGRQAGREEEILLRWLGRLTFTTLSTHITIM